MPKAAWASAGDIMTADFELAGQAFTIINGGPHFQHSPAMSLLVHCADQAELDKLWDALIAGGGEPSRCGWLTDRFGVSWQITPTRLGELLASGDSAAVERVTQAFSKWTSSISPSWKGLSTMTKPKPTRSLSGASEARPIPRITPVENRRREPWLVHSRFWTLTQ